MRFEFKLRLLCVAKERPIKQLLAATLNCKSLASLFLREFRTAENSDSSACKWRLPLTPGR